MPEATDHRTVPPLVGGDVDDEAPEGQVQLIESAEDLEQLDDGEDDYPRS